LTVRKRVAPLLLRLQWKGFPICHSREHGWVYRIPGDGEGQVADAGVIFDKFKDTSDARLAADTTGIYVKIPHHAGGDANVGNPMSKNFLRYIDSGVLASAPAEDGVADNGIANAAADAMNMNAQCSYWISARERIHDQMDVYAPDIGTMGFDEASEQDNNLGIILPRVITMGTVTRRAVEATWLTASNAKKNRVGSELKAMIRAPPGYAIVGADVDSEELWIASVMGDSQFGLHGATAIGWMTLEGTKAAGTDLHSKTAKILKTTRDNAKVFNYSRIYGAGLKHALQLLKQNNPNLSDKEAATLANNLYVATKGMKTRAKQWNKNGPPQPDDAIKSLWHGGSESYLFNTLERIATSSLPQTPALGCGVTDALKSVYLPKNGAFGTDYLPSRINWVVQSSGVDYLHLLIIGMEYLLKKYDIKARYMISLHDELRYLVEEKDKYRAALALQIVNAWTRALLCYNLGMHDLPQGVTFFSAVDIDRYLRKEVDMPCVTPSQPIPLPRGESLDIEGLLKITNADLGSTHGEQDLEPVTLTQVTPPPDLENGLHEMYLRAQAGKDEKAVLNFIKLYNATRASPKLAATMVARADHTDHMEDVY
jgi:DNA polymerase gamma 1